jgi:hypothetical protein
MSSHYKYSDLVEIRNLVLEKIYRPVLHYLVLYCIRIGSACCFASGS